MKWLRIILWILTVAYWALLFTMTHLPPPKLPAAPGNDKLMHFLAYLVLSLMLGVTLRLTFPRWRRVPLIVLLIGVIYGALDERTQLLVNRSAEWGDWFADAGGVCTSVLVLWLTNGIGRSRAAGHGNAAAADARRPGTVPQSA